MDDGWTTFRSGFWPLSFQMPTECCKRYFDELVPAMSATRRRILGARNKDCYYLGYIGTKPGARGRGYASRLIRDITDRADAHQCPVYLESSAGENMAFYRRLGFEVQGQIELSRGPAPLLLDCMVREPKAGEAGGA